MLNQDLKNVEGRFDLGNIRIANNCPSGHVVVELCDGDFAMAEIHLPSDTKLRDISTVVEKFFRSQL